MKLVIIRRPETNKDADITGEAEAPSPAGKEQLVRAAKVCKEAGAQAIIYSTKPRAAMASKDLAQALKLPAIAQNGLEERNFGDWDAWEWTLIADRLNKLSIDERYTFVAPNGESWEQMERRLHSALQTIAARGYDSVAIVTHSGPIRALLPMLRSEPRESTLQLSVANGETFVEDYDVAPAA
jgi:broad specificity phosphatase PhoE